MNTDLKFDKVENLFDRDTGIFECMDDDKKLPKAECRWKPRITEMVPVLPTSMESDSLKNITSDALVRQMLSGNLVEKLDRIFPQADSVLNCYEYRNRKDILNYDDYPEMNENLVKIMKAILIGKKIKYTNQTKHGIYKDKTASPYKLVYSARLNRLQVIAKPEEEDRVILMNAEGIKEVEILEETSEDMKELIESRKKELVIAVDSDNNKARQQNTVERCFSLFSHLDKVADYDEKTGRHELTVKYYEYDEQDIIKDILSLGSAVIVEKPVEVREQIINTLKKMYGI